MNNMKEENLELNEKTKKELEERRIAIRKGRFIPHEEVKRRLRLRMNRKI